MRCRRSATPILPTSTRNGEIAGARWALSVAPCMLSRARRMRSKLFRNPDVAVLREMNRYPDMKSHQSGVRLRPGTALSLCMHPTALWHLQHVVVQAFCWPSECETACSGDRRIVHLEKSS